MTKRFGFTYVHCHDLHAMRAFYRDVLLLEQIWDEEISAAFRIGDHQLAFFTTRKWSHMNPCFHHSPDGKAASHFR
ncbi:hypothetical protein CR205_03470 [Alteribacter lacisalsi]|uniref:Glyoxalase/fosfomycin resistance/dioxygenase domain-containing protein n=1 Tax=Alteribacter lacisalsi TaxID=2045244 RepID=A0A2W0HJI8_9BACI|nr:hypothetical protein [Alteribacter lacisalsi]PYZ97665.1 hypothetical protein CR205_03470 [Alteribacter lacisalsi]